jgi:hypothetical protein
VFAHLVTATKDQLKKIAAATEPLKPDFLLLITNKRPAQNELAVFKTKTLIISGNVDNSKHICYCNFSTY